MAPSSQTSTRKERIRVERVLLNAAEVAQILGCSRAKAYQMLNDGELPALRFGKSIRSPRPDLMSWIEKRTRPAA
jgi:excisionase family DNA binding protein